MRTPPSLVLLCIACLLFAGLCTWIARNAAPGTDEGWFASPAYNLLNEGHIGTTVLDPHGYILRPEFKGLEKYTYWVLPAHLVLQAGWYKLFGFSLMAMRALSIAWGFVLLISLYTIGRHITGEQGIAALATLLLGSDLLITQQGADGRMDMMCLGLGFAAQAVYLAWRKQRPGLALFISHLLISWSGLTHPNGIIPAACLWVLMGADVLENRRAVRGWGFRPVYVLWVVLPYVLSGGLYAAFALQDASSFQAQIAANNAGGGRTYYLLHPWEAITGEIERYRLYYGLNSGANPFAWVKSIVLFLLLGGFVGTWVRGRVLLGVLAAVPLLGLTFFNFKNEYYLIYAIPYLALSAASFYGDWIFSRQPGRFLRWALVAAMAVLLLVNIAGTVRRGFQIRARANEYADIAFLVTPLLPAEGRIMASPQFAFLFGFDRVVQDDTMGYYSGKQWDIMVEFRFSEEELENIRRQAPEVVAHRERLLTGSFEEIFHGATSSVYRRRPEAPPLSAPSP